MAPIPKRRVLQQKGRVRRNQFSRLKGITPDAGVGGTEGNRPQTNRPKQREKVIHPEDDSASSEDEVYLNAQTSSYSVLLHLFPESNAKEQRRKRRKVGHSPHGDASDAKARQDEILPSQKLQQQREIELEQSDSEADQREHDVDIDIVDTGTADADEDDTSDPFDMHFDNPDENHLSQRLKAIAASSWTTEQLASSTIGKVSFTSPNSDTANPPDLGSHISSLKDLKLKRRLMEPALRACPRFSPLQSALVPGIFHYADLLFGGRTVDNAESLRKIACLHALNHVFKTRDRIMKNTARRSRHQSDVDLDLRDQGFTRPKILILLETRQSCIRYMDTITGLCDPQQQENKKRFQDAFLQTEDKFSEDKPMDFRELFEGNDDNEFRLGVKFTRKTLKYYSQFYSSDIILASPLGLRRAIKSDDAKKSDSDFLSSIEMVIVDQADAMLMQNWEHVEFVLSHLNLQPKEPHGCDFSRVRQWYLDQNAKYLRQTIVFSAYLTPELNALFSAQMQNVAGKVKGTPTYAGAMLELSSQLPIRQTFTRFPSTNLAADPDTRFRYFTTAVLSSLARHQPSVAAASALGALIFIPSYMDFVRIRNHFSNAQDTAHLSFGSISEYSPLPAVRRARSHFLSGRHDVLLYTGRAHHFWRYKIKGVKHVVLYGIPENPAFYAELVGGFLGDSIAEGRVDAGDANVRSIFSKWDALALERIVGSARVGRMIREGDGDTFEFR